MDLFKVGDYSQQDDVHDWLKIWEGRISNTFIYISKEKEIWIIYRPTWRDEVVDEIEIDNYILNEKIAHYKSFHIELFSYFEKLWVVL